MSSNLVEQAVEVFKRGGVVVFPTDTVWGIGASIDSKEGIEKLYKVKKREPEKPTAVLVKDLEMAEKYGVFNDKARALAQKYWPGGLTIVVEAKKEVPTEILGISEMVGLRAPNHEMIGSIIDALGSGVVASSANFAGGVAPMSRDQVSGFLVEMVDVITDGEAGGAMSSTVVKVVGNNIEVLRQGDVVVD